VEPGEVAKASAGIWRQMTRVFVTGIELFVDGGRAQVLILVFNISSPPGDQGGSRIQARGERVLNAAIIAADISSGWEIRTINKLRTTCIRLLILRSEGRFAAF